PTTPPETFAETVITGSTPMDVAVVAWSFPNTALDEVSEPVIKTPNHPSIGAKKGNNKPVPASAWAIVIVIPESLTKKANAKTDAMVNIGNRSCCSVDRNILNPSLNFNPVNGIAMTAESKMAVPDAERKLNLKMCGNAFPSLSNITLWSPGNSNCTWPT